MPPKLSLIASSLFLLAIAPFGGRALATVVPSPRADSTAYLASVQSILAERLAWENTNLDIGSICSRGHTYLSCTEQLITASEPRSSSDLAVMATLILKAAVRDRNLTFKCDARCQIEIELKTVTQTSALLEKTRFRDFAVVQWSHLNQGKPGAMLVQLNEEFATVKAVQKTRASALRALTKILNHPRLTASARKSAHELRVRVKSLRLKSVLEGAYLVSRASDVVPQLRAELERDTGQAQAPTLFIREFHALAHAISVERPLRSEN